MFLSVVIAVYNERENLKELTGRLLNSLKKLNLFFEIIYVVDGNDGSYKLLDNIRVNNNKIFIDYSRDLRGFKKSFIRGFSLVNKKATHILTMDADLNHQPEETIEFINAMKKYGCDVVVGSRYIELARIEKLPLWKRCLSKLANLVTKLFFEIKIEDKTSGFRLYKREVIDNVAFKCKSNGFEFLFEILIRAHRKNYKIIEIPIIFKARGSGQSKFEVMNTLKGYLNLLLMNIQGELK